MTTAACQAKPQPSLASQGDQWGVVTVEACPGPRQDPDPMVLPALTRGVWLHHNSRGQGVATGVEAAMAVEEGGRCITLMTSRMEGAGPPQSMDTATTSTTQTRQPEE